MTRARIPGHAQPPRRPRPPPPRRLPLQGPEPGFADKTIVCLGDSITVGVGSGPGESYPERLAGKLGVDVVNEGESGDTAAQGLARLDQVLADDPWMVIVELGGNDILHQVPPQQTEGSLRQILEELLAARTVPVLVEVDAPFGASYKGIYGRLGKEYHVPVVEDAIGKILRDRSLKSDTVHPNAEGRKCWRTLLRTRSDRS